MSTGTHDFMGLNYYTALMGQAGVEGHVPSRYRDTGAITTQDPSWPSSASSWLKASTLLSTSANSHLCIKIH